jgi:hypothetical protein
MRAVTAEYDRSSIPGIEWSVSNDAAPELRDRLMTMKADAET